MRRITGLLALLTALAMLAAACGDDSEPSGADASEAAEDLLDDIQDGLEEGGDPSDVVEDAQEAAEDFIEGLGAAEGSGTMSIAGESIDFDTEICFSGQGDFTAEGGGAASDGTPVWVSISYSEDSREEVLEFLDEAAVELAYGDADPIINQTVSVDFGREELFGSGADDLPAYYADSGFGATEGMTVDISVDGQSASGSGVASDTNFVSGDFADTFEFSFEARCG